MRTELVTSLKRKATRIIARLEDDQEPVLITHRGRPAAYLVDVERYDAAAKRLALLEGISRGEQAIREGRVLTHDQAKRRMARWFK